METCGALVKQMIMLQILKLLTWGGKRSPGPNCSSLVDWTIRPALVLFPFLAFQSRPSIRDIDTGYVSAPC